jgi:hypothetical protein
VLQIDQLATSISNAFSDDVTIREVSIVTHSVCSIFEVVKFKSFNELFSLCKFDISCFEFYLMKDLVDLALVSIVKNQIFYEWDMNLPMWKTISALLFVLQLERQFPFKKHQEVEKQKLYNTLVNSSMFSFMRS